MSGSDDVHAGIFAVRANPVAAWMRRLRLAGLLLAAIAGSLGGMPAARAAGPRLLLDRAELEPSWFPGLARLRLHVTAIQLEGSLIAVGASDPFVLAIGGNRRREPYLVGRYAASGGATALVVVVQTGWEMRDDLDVMREAIAELLDGLPPGSQVAVVSYGEAVDGGHRLSAARGADRRLDGLQADPAPADPQLLAAVERALATLVRARAPDRERAPLRRMVVVIGDGNDVDPDPARYRAVGERAGRKDVRVHSIAHSPVDNRGPLLGLGELSKRSGGTFRWARSREGLRAQVGTLLAEINQQYVLTFFVPPEDVAGKRLALRYADLESNQVRVGELRCGGQTCGADQLCVRHACVARGSGTGGAWWRWVLWVAGGLVALALVTGAVGALVTRARRPGVPAPSAGAAPALGWILVVAGPDQGQRVPVRHGFLVGSARGCDLTVAGDPQVAPHHAVFVTGAGGDVAVVDRGSAAGTFVNGVRITEARLQHGNLIRIGSCSLRYLSQ
jgi:FHA domain/von Willebrand factor type A domain